LDIQTLPETGAAAATDDAARRVMMHGHGAKGLALMEALS
jgi:hypothetical protein